jgi:hypothetical protein
MAEENASRTARSTYMGRRLCCRLPGMYEHEVQDFPEKHKLKRWHAVAGRVESIADYCGKLGYSTEVYHTKRVRNCFWAILSDLSWLLLEKMNHHISDLKKTCSNIAIERRKNVLDRVGYIPKEKDIRILKDNTDVIAGGGTVCQALEKVG